MSTIGSVSGLSNLSYVPPASNKAQPSGGDADGGGNSGAGQVGGSNFMQAIMQALDRVCQATPLHRLPHRQLTQPHLPLPLQALPRVRRLHCRCLCTACLPH